MKKELTMTMIIMLALIAVSLGFRQILLKPAAEAVWNFSYLAALVAAGAGLTALFGVFIKRILLKQT